MLGIPVRACWDFQHAAHLTLSNVPKLEGATLEVYAQHDVLERTANDRQATRETPKTSGVILKYPEASATIPKQLERSGRIRNCPTLSGSALPRLREGNDNPSREQRI